MVVGEQVCICTPVARYEPKKKKSGYKGALANIRQNHPWCSAKVGAQKRTKRIQHRIALWLEIHKLLIET